jgi:hypothetical protein
MNNLKSFAVISAKAFFSWVCINALTLLATLIAFGTGFFLLSKNINMEQVSHQGAVTILGMAANRPLASVLLLLIAISPFFFFVLSNKYVIKQVAKKIVDSKANALIEPFIDKIIHKFKASSPGLFNAGSNAVEFKSKLIDKINTEAGNKWVKLVLISVVNKLTLDDTDFSEKNISFEELLKTKILESLQDFVSPSLDSIIFVIAMQWVFVLIAYYSPY